MTSSSLPTSRDPQLLTFHPRHYDAIVAGTKRVTVRWQERIVIGATIFVFDPPLHAPLRGWVLDVSQCRTSTMSSRDLHEPTDTDLSKYVVALQQNYYPSMPDDTVLEVVTFALASDSSEPSSASRTLRE